MIIIDIQWFYLGLTKIFYMNQTKSNLAEFYHTQTDVDDIIIIY